MKTDPPNEADLLQSTLTSTGSSLASLSQGKPLLLVLLRHSGCTFCRKAMADIARLRPRIEKEGTQIVLGHMGTEADFPRPLRPDMVCRIFPHRRPERRLYGGLGLRRGSWMQLIRAPASGGRGRSRSSAAMAWGFPGRRHADAGRFSYPSRARCWCASNTRIPRQAGLRGAGDAAGVRLQDCVPGPFQRAPCVPSCLSSLRNVLSGGR